MKNVIILGATGNIARCVTDILLKKNDINLTLFLRDKQITKQGRFQNVGSSKATF